MPFRFSNRSYDNLRGVHQDLVAVAVRALELTKVDFGIGDGLRTPAEQQANIDAGRSWTKNSRHLSGHAIDVIAFDKAGKYVNGDCPDEYKLYEQIAEAFKAAALELGVPIVWGGDWRLKKDGCHYELDRRTYP